jgi:hypothetical protein
VTKGSVVETVRPRASWHWMYAVTRHVDDLGSAAAVLRALTLATE